jgi:tRNA 2-selenouridine synthase
MRKTPLIHVEVPFETRVKHLVSVYCQTSKEDLVLAFQKITKKLGYDVLKKAVEFVENGDFESAAAIALKYYDKAYTYNLDNNTSPNIIILEAPDFNITQIAEQLIERANAL